MVFKAKTKELVRRAFDEGYAKGYEAGMQSERHKFDADLDRGREREQLLADLDAQTPESNDA